MARIRSIKPDFFLDDELAALPPLVRILFQGLWCMADRRGRLEDRPAKIKANVLPYDNFDAEEALNLLAKARGPRKKGWIERYEVDGIKCIAVLNFEKHQRISGKEAESESLLPPPPSEPTGKRRGSTREAVGKHPGLLEGKGREEEGRGKEGKGEATSASPATPASSPLPETPFSAFVREHWPDVKNPEERERDWKQACPAVDLLAEARKAWSWEQESPQNRKVDHASFLGRWFRKCQDQPRSTSPPLPFTRNGTAPKPVGLAPLPSKAEWEAIRLAEQKKKQGGSDG